MPAGFYESAYAVDKRSMKMFDRVKMLGIKDTPFLSSLTTFSPTQSISEPANGIQWSFMIRPDAANDNAHLEGSDPAPSQYYLSRLAKNHFQIFKQSYSVSRSVGGNSDHALALQQDMCEIAFRKDINKALLHNLTSVQRTTTVAGKLRGAMGVKIASNTLDCAAQPLDMELIEEALLIALNKDIFIDTLYCDSRVLAKLSKLRREINRDTVGNTTLVGFEYKKLDMRNSPSTINIIVENQMPANTIMFGKKSNYGIVRYRDFHEKFEQNGKDAISGQYIAELSFIFENPYSLIFMENFT